MRLLSCATALTIALLQSAPAQAAEVADFTGSVADVTITNLVEVPLYMAPDQSLIPCIKVRIYDKEYLFALHIGDRIHISERTAEALSLEPRSRTFRHYNDGEPIHYADIPKISLGSLDLHDVRVTTAPPPSTHALTSIYASGQESGIAFDGIIGLQAIPQVGWAILPSRGVVAFVPGDQGLELVNSLRSDVLRYRSTVEVIEQFGESPKQRMPSGDLIVPAQLGGQPADVHLNVFQWEATLSTAQPLSPSAELHSEGRTYTWQPIQAGSAQPVPGWVEQSGAYQQLADSAYKNNYADGVIGNRILSQLDIAADPQTQSITFRKANAQVRSDPMDFLLPEALAATQSDDATPENSSTEDSTADRPVNAEAWARLGTLYAMRGRLDEAIDAYQTALSSPDTAQQCTSWLQIGRLQLSANRIADATASFAQASTLYHQWWDQSLEEREALAEALAELDEDEAPSHTIQPGSCHVADGWLAGAHLSDGNVARVQEVHDAHHDLDSQLTLVAGNAALMQGDLDRAQATYRQATQQHNTESFAVRLGLALAYEASGDWESARQLYEAAVADRASDVLAVQIWIDATARAASPQEAVQTALAYRQQNPDRAAAYIAIARAAWRAGDEAEQQRVQEAGDRFFAQGAWLYPNNSALQAAHAMFLLETRRLDGARQKAEQTLLSDPGNTIAWVTLGNLYILQGDTERGERLLHRAGRLKPLHPGYVLLMQASVVTADAAEE